MQTVLLTAVGSASALAALTSLRRAGYRVIGCDIYPMAWNITSGEVDAFFIVPPASDAQAYAEALLTAAPAYGIDFVIPLTDVEVDALSPRKEAFRAAGVTVCCPEGPVAARCRDKLGMAEMLGAAGVCRVIPTWTRATLPQDPPYPLMVKPQRGRSSQNQRVVETPEALASALAQREDAILQPYLPGTVYTVDCARDALGGTVTVTRRELLRTVNGLGTSVEICPGHPLDAVCANALALADIVGVVNLEFIRHGQDDYFLEINPRFSGGVGFSVLAGYDFPLAMLRCHEGLPLPPPPALRRMTLAQRYEMRVTEG